jgi:hypothetical protein
MPPTSQSTGSERLARRVLRAPAVVRRVAASQAKDPAQAWMLRQPDSVRESYLREVLDRGGDERLTEIWMLRQPEAVRESYITAVLEPRLPAKLRRASG